MSDFTPAQIKVVVTAHLLGASHFDQSCSQPDVLGQLFCYAVRDVLEEEMQMTGRSRAEILKDLAQQTASQVAPDTYEAFASLREEEFDRLYSAVLNVADQSHLTTSELLDGLAAVNAIMDEFVSHGSDDLELPGS